MFHQPVRCIFASFFQHWVKSTPKQASQYIASCQSLVQSCLQTEVAHRSSGNTGLKVNFTLEGTKGMRSGCILSVTCLIYTQRPVTKQRRSEIVHNHSPVAYTRVHKLPPDIENKSSAAICCGFSQRTTTSQTSNVAFL